MSETDYLIDNIVIHHSATKDGRLLSWTAIKRYHVEERGWADIGYHVGIELYEGEYVALLGRPWTQVGAHARGRNHDSLGVCLVGNFDLDRPPDGQWLAAVQCVVWLSRLFGIPVDRVRGHREVSEDRTCPGRFFDMDAFRRDIEDVGRE